MRDELFIRGGIPMTKSEVRAVSLSKLEPGRTSIVYDIGAGTGSVSIEAALAAAEGHVYAFEQKEEGCALIRRNAEKFGVTNLTVVPGKAPGTLCGIGGMQEHKACVPPPDCVFIGGSGGSLSEILDFLLEANPKVRVVLNVAALETLSQITDYVNRNQIETEFVSVQISRGEKLGGFHLMKGGNPVYVVTINP